MTIAEELQKLAQLRDSGVLSDTEFEEQKRRLLWPSQPAGGWAADPARPSSFVSAGAPYHLPPWAGYPPAGSAPYQQPSWQLPQSSPWARSEGYSIAGIVLGVVAFVFIPIAFGPAGLILGAVGQSRGESKATIAMVVSCCGLVVGMLLGIIVYQSALT